VIRRSADNWDQVPQCQYANFTLVDIHQAMEDQATKDKMPYLLFYQIQPLLDETLPEITEEEKPPSYSERLRDRNGLKFEWHSTRNMG